MGVEDGEYLGGCGRQMEAQTKRGSVTEEERPNPIVCFHELAAT